MDTKDVEEQTHPTRRWLLNGLGSTAGGIEQASPRAEKRIWIGILRGCMRAVMTIQGSPSIILPEIFRASFFLSGQRRRTSATSQSRLSMCTSGVGYPSWTRNNPFMRSGPCYFFIKLEVDSHNCTSA